MLCFDGIGQAGGDSMNGRNHVYCNHGVSYRFGRTWSRRSVGFGYGIGRGNQHMFWETGLPCWARSRADRSAPGPYHETDRSWEGEVEILKKEAKTLEDDLIAIERHRDELEAEIFN